MNKILVIEDEASVLENLVELLEAEDFKVLAARNGLEGINLAQECKPELVLCDITMPEMDGYTVLNHLRKNPEIALTPFIFLTAKTALSEIRDGMDLGADDYLTKPFSRNELLKAITTRISKQNVFHQKTENQLNDLQKSISNGISEKIFKPLEQISMTSELFVQHHDSMKPDEIKELGNFIKINSNILHRSIQNFFFYKELKDLYSNAFVIEQDSLTMRPGDYILMIATQKSKKYRRHKDLNLNIVNAQLRIGTNHWKKILDEFLDFVFSFSRENTPIVINTCIKDTHYCYSIQCDAMNLSSTLRQKMQAETNLKNDFFEDLDPGLGLLVIQEILSLHGSELSVKMNSDQLNDELILSFLLPIEFSDESQP